MLEQKTHWQAAKFIPPYSTKITGLATNADPNSAYIFDFEPQRIRQFEIEFNQNGAKAATSSPKQKEVGGLNLVEEEWTFDPKIVYLRYPLYLI